MFRELPKVFTPEELIGKNLPFIVNLEYRKFKGEESQGMLMAIDFEGKTVLLRTSPPKCLPEQKLYEVGILGLGKWVHASPKNCTKKGIEIFVWNRTLK